jgi:hypothetical protein
VPNTPFRRPPKIGRNDPCPCGSGRKFKLCHGGREYELPNLAAKARLEKFLETEGRQLLEEHKAKELQRQKQQGLGRPIISLEHKGIRHVAVANRLYSGKWKTFSDFLFDYLRNVFGTDWGNAELKKPLQDRHQVLQWYDRICALQQKHRTEVGAVYTMPMTGAASAYLRLSYNLYLIAHNGTDIESRLIARLKNRDNFQGAFFETQVAAWLIRAGFELEFEDETDTSTSHCEFTATYKVTGDKYSVEAKSRAIGPDGQPAKRLPVGRQLRQALRKAAKYRRLVFIDLNKTLHTEAEAHKVIDRAQEILRRAEASNIDGQPAPRAYVCLTNLADQYALDGLEIGTAVSFHGFKIRDFVDAPFPSIREALRARERHWPMFELLKSIKEHREIPTTFGGELPSEALSPGRPPRIQIGRTYLVPGPDGREVPAKVTQAIVMDGKAMCAFHDPVSNQAWMTATPMTPDELEDYRRFPDTYFGVYVQQNRSAKTLVEMFDFLFESYRDTPKEKLLEFMAGSRDIVQLRELSQKELAEIFCERSAYSFMALGQQNKATAS